MRLKRRPIGMPTADDFELATVDVADPAPGQVLVRTLYLHMAPTIRNWLNPRDEHDSNRIYYPEILPGTTRELALRLAARACIGARIAPIPEATLRAADMNLRACTMPSTYISTARVS